MKLSTLGQGLQIAVDEGPYFQGAISELEPEIVLKLYRDRAILYDTVRRVYAKVSARMQPNHPIVLMLLNAMGEAESDWASESPEPPVKPLRL